MTDLSAVYQHVARPWSPDELSAHYNAADRDGQHGLNSADDQTETRPISLLSSAMPHAARLSVAMHVIHVVPAYAAPELVAQLLDTAQIAAGSALQRGHRALDQHGRDHAYTTHEWMPVIYDTTASLLASARLDCDPPSLVQHAQHAVDWLSRAIASLDQGTPDAAEAIADALSHLLSIAVFTELARINTRPA